LSRAQNWCKNTRYLRGSGASDRVWTSLTQQCSTEFCCLSVLYRVPSSAADLLGQNAVCTLRPDTVALRATQECISRLNELFILVAAIARTSSQQKDAQYNQRRVASGVEQPIKSTLGASQSNHIAVSSPIPYCSR
jgi:hypothetical protein